MSNTLNTRFTFFLLTLAFATTLQAGVIRSSSESDELIPTGKGWGERPVQSQGKTTVGNAATGKLRTVTYPNGISYHNGPLMLGSTNVYYIWYGNWAGNTATSILSNFANSLGGSPYYNINTTYFDKNKIHPSNSVMYSGSSNDNYSLGTALTDANVGSIVNNAIASGSLPKNSNAVYFVLTSADVSETSGFCTQYCGWHTHGLIGGTDIKYSFVGNPDRCPNACATQSVSPNNNAGADGMTSIVAHELEEAVTDPDFNAWYDTKGQENADKCAWTFGTTYTTANASTANMNLGGYDYLIQQNWVNAAGGYCATSY